MDRPTLISLAQSALDDARAAQRLHLGAIERLGVVIDQLATLEMEPQAEEATPAHLRPPAEPPRLSTIGPAKPPAGVTRLPMSFADPNEYPIDQELRERILSFTEGGEDESPEEPTPA